MPTYNEIGSGGALGGGDFTVYAIYPFVASGGAFGGGDADVLCQHNVLSVGGGVGGGTAPSHGQFKNLGHGGAKGGGAATVLTRLTYDADGGPALTGGSADASYSIFFNQDIRWKTRATLEINKSFEWTTGLSPLRWFRIQGCCKFPTARGDGLGLGMPGGCDATGIQTDDAKCVGALGKQQFIQNVVARSVSDVCDQLSDGRINWEICSIKQWSRPADGRLVAPDDQCNILTEVPHCQIPQCLKFCLDTDAVVHMGMFTTTIDTIMAYTGTGGATTGGSADAAVVVGPTPTQSFFEYEADGGNTLTGGEAGVTSSWDMTPLTTMGMFTTVENLEAVFGVNPNDAPLVILTPVISTNCGSCDSMPLVLYLHHNIVNDSVLLNYMHRNGLDFPNPLPMHYSSRLQSWVANYHLRGTSDDNRGSVESWRFTFDWSCVAGINGDELGAAGWKFSMLAVRKNEASDLDYDSRAVVFFPPDQICQGGQNLGFEFSFKLNTVTKFVSNDLNIVPNVVLLTDNIGVFKSKFWSQNPNLSIRLSNSALNVGVQRQDIFPIFPQAIILGDGPTNPVTR